MPEAVNHFAAAVEMIQQPRMLETAVRQLANAHSLSGNADGAVAALEAAIAVVEREDRELALVLEAELAAKAQQASREARAPAAKRLERHGELRGATRGERLVLASIAFEQARSSESASEAARHIERAPGRRPLDRRAGCRRRRPVLRARAWLARDGRARSSRNIHRARSRRRSRPRLDSGDGVLAGSSGLVLLEARRRGASGG